MKTMAHSDFFQTGKDDIVTNETDESTQLSSTDFMFKARFVFDAFAKAGTLPNGCDSFRHLLNDYSQTLKTLVQIEMIAEMKKSVEKIQFFL